MRFQAKTLALIEKIGAIVDTYAQDGLDLTVRQLYYQLVARGQLRNDERSYKRIVSVVSNARMAGLLDWSRIVDRTRALRGHSHWDKPGEVIKSASEQFRFDLWENQPERVEVWIEKDALIGVIAGVCGELDVPYFSCRGYPSQSSMWRTGRRLYWRTIGEQVQSTVVLHLGDHDPSGIDMTRDIHARVAGFLDYHDQWEAIDVDRIALTMVQIEEYGPPPNPAKMSDSRAPDYVAEYGYDSWELDALDPRTMRDLVREHIEAHMDREQFDLDLERQEAARAQLGWVASHFDEIVEGADGGQADQALDSA